MTFVFDYRVTLFLMFKPFLCIVCESFLVKLTSVKVHDKKESKLFSLASWPVRIKFISFQSASNKLKRLISAKSR